MQHALVVERSEANNHNIQGLATYLYSPGDAMMSERHSALAYVYT